MQAQDEPTYYAEGLEVWKASMVVASAVGRQTITVGFKVCTATGEVGADGAKAIAALLTLAERGQGGSDAR
jgi:hypothetical protein